MSPREFCFSFFFVNLAYITEGHCCIFLYFFLLIDVCLGDASGFLYDYSVVMWTIWIVSGEGWASCTICLFAGEE